MHSFQQAIAFLGSVLICYAEAFHAPFGHNAAQSRVMRSVACRQRLAAYNEQPITMGFKSPLDVLKQGIARAGAGSYNKGAVQLAIANYKSDNKVVVFSWTRCPFCKKAKGLLEDIIEDRSDYEFVELDEMDDGNAIRYELSQETGRTSVPQIWIGGEFVGGCNDGPGIFTLQERGQLGPKLVAAGCNLK